jgi:hypothetical protein
LRINCTASNGGKVLGEGYRTIETGANKPSHNQFTAFQPQFITEWELDIEVNTAASDVATQLRISSQSQSGESNHGQKLHFDVRYLTFR